MIVIIDANEPEISGSRIGVSMRNLKFNKENIHKVAALNNKVVFLEDEKLQIPYNLQVYCTPDGNTAEILIPVRPINKTKWNEEKHMMGNRYSLHKSDFLPYGEIGLNCWRLEKKLDSFNAQYERFCFRYMGIGRLSFSVPASRNTDNEIYFSSVEASNTFDSSLGYYFSLPEDQRPFNWKELIDARKKLWREILKYHLVRESNKLINTIQDKLDTIKNKFELIKKYNHAVKEYEYYKELMKPEEVSLTFLKDAFKQESLLSMVPEMYREELLTLCNKLNPVSDDYDTFLKLGMLFARIFSSQSMYRIINSRLQSNAKYHDPVGFTVRLANSIQAEFNEMVTSDYKYRNYQLLDALYDYRMQKGKKVVDNLLKAIDELKTAFGEGLTKMITFDAKKRQFKSSPLINIENVLESEDSSNFYFTLKNLAGKVFGKFTYQITPIEFKKQKYVFSAHSFWSMPWRKGHEKQYVQAQIFFKETEEMKRGEWIYAY